MENVIWESGLAILGLRRLSLMELISPKLNWGKLILEEECVKLTFGGFHGLHTAIAGMFYIETLGQVSVTVTGQYNMAISGFDGDR